MIFRKIVVTAAIACLVLAFTACSDDDSSSFVEPEKESSDSGATLSGDSHEGSSPSSCSSKDDKSSSSVSSSSTNSSSSAKSSSSTDVKSSSSVTSNSSGTSAGSSAGTNSSSGEEKRPCSEEGKTQRANGVKVICHDGFWVPESSSSAVPTSSYFDMTEQFNPDVEYGEFTDPRDGHKYRTVNVYDGKFFTDTLIFFAENLNFGKMVPGGTVLGDSAKYCYDDDPWYCDNGWGGLYTWSAAMNIPSICDSVELGLEKCPYEFQRDNDGVMIDGDVIHQGICPEGWHIVHDGEWAYLQQKSGNSVAHYMGSKVAGFGNNDYGLSILPTGCWIPLGGKFDSIKKYSLYWLPQQYPDYDDSAYGVIIQSRDVSRTARSVKTQAFPVRCVKNY